MQMLNQLSLYGIVLAVLVLTGAWVAAGVISNGAQLIQRVEPSAVDALFADTTGTPIGSPQMLIINDPAAFIEGQGPEGSRLVNETYLRQNNIYPLQLVTVHFFRNVVSAAALVGLVLLTGLYWWTRRSGGRQRATKITS